MDTLEKVINSFVENGYKRENIEADRQFQDTELSDDYIMAAIKSNIKQRIIDEVVMQKKKELDQYAKQRVAEEKNKSHIAAIKQLLWEGFIVAIFVGLLGNEITTLGDFLKTRAGGSWYIIITIILIGIYTVAVLGLYIVKFTKDIINNFTKKGK
mgnify:CR=1 FL=1